MERRALDYMLDHGYEHATLADNGGVLIKRGAGQALPDEVIPTYDAMVMRAMQMQREAGDIT